MKQDNKSAHNGLDSKTMISICLCTFKRDYVFQTLKSIAEQELPDGVEVEVIVINNDPQTDLRDRIQKFADDVELAIKYDVEPEQNISLARNRSVGLSKGDWIAFIDDDETAAPNWLASLYSAALAHDADVVMGVVSGIFPEGTSDWFVKAQLFERNQPRTGTPQTIGRTGNALLRASWVKENGHSFEPSYGLTGGGDYLFFQQILKDGGKMIACQEAVVYEFNDNKRLNMGYLARRALRGGEGYARIHSTGNSLPVQAAGVVLTIVKMIAFAGYSCCCIPFGKYKSVPPLLRSITQIGKLRHILGIGATEIYRVKSL